MSQTITAKDLVPMDIFKGREPIEIDLAYADANHPDNVFNTDIYHENARLWAHRDLAAITLLAARSLKCEHNWTLQLKDCLRTTEAQEIIIQTELVKAHPEWIGGGNNCLLALPGGGGHPRAMAMDVCVLDIRGQQMDMGTPFDYFTSNLDDNPAARSYEGHTEEVNKRRIILEGAFVKAAGILDLSIYPYPEEWWDFRFAADFYNKFYPLSDKDLPRQMRMSSTEEPDIPDLSEECFESLAHEITALLNKHDGNF